MKKILHIIEIVFTALIIVVVIGFAVLSFKKPNLDEESKAYVDEVTPKILADLRKETLFRYSSEELKNSATENEVKELFSSYEKLGKFIEYKESHGSIDISSTAQIEKLISGHYTAKVEFESGPAVIKIITIKKGDRWQIIGFHINSKALTGDAS